MDRALPAPVFSSELTALLDQWAEGCDHSLAELVTRAYRELHKLARHHLARERRGHTLQPTELVHEIYMKLLDLRHPAFKNRSQFYSFSGRVMRRVLVDYARKKVAAKRTDDGVEAVHSTERAEGVGGLEPAEMIALDQALKRLKRLDARKSQFLEHLYFAGMKVGEIAELYETSESTVHRELRAAKHWLNYELTKHGGRHGGRTGNLANADAGIGFA